jgi:hypothetical protein
MPGIAECRPISSKRRERARRHRRRPSGADERSVVSRRGDDFLSIHRVCAPPLSLLGGAAGGAAGLSESAFSANELTNA